jgi:glycine cleavage system H protein
MNVPEDLRYSAEHEWARALEDTSLNDRLRVRIGITDYAQDALGDVVYVDLPAVGASFGAGESLGELESTKSVSEVYAPVAGTVVAVNEALADNPQLLNEDPYGEGWLIELEPASGDLGGSDLLDAAAYRALTEG